MIALNADLQIRRQRIMKTAILERWPMGTRDGVASGGVRGKGVRRGGLSQKGGVPGWRQATGVSVAPAAAPAAAKAASARSSAYRGLITSLISANRASNGMNADFIAFTVNHCMSSSVYPNAVTSRANSLLIDVSLISRLSVLTVTRK